MLECEIEDPESYKNRKMVLELWEQGLSVMEIARKLSFSHVLVQKIMVHLGVRYIPNIMPATKFQIEKLIEIGASYSSIKYEYGLNNTQIRRIQRWCEKNRHLEDHYNGPQEGDPSPEQIKDKMKSIRKTWTFKDMQSRQIPLHPIPRISLGD